MGKVFKPIGKALKSVTNFVSKAFSSVISWLVPKPKLPNFGGNTYEGAKGILVNQDSNNASIPVVYGERKVGISRVFIESSGSDNTNLYIAGILCEGGGSGIQSVEEIYIDDKLVTWSGALSDGTLRTVNSSDTNFFKGGASLISVQAFYGLDNQSASSILDETTNWTSDHKLSGVAYLAFKFTWNQDAFSGLPDIKVIVKGKKVYDPRLDTTKAGSGSHRQDDPTTWAYSDNSSLVLLDYLRNVRYGKGLPNDAFETNYDSFKTSANDCDTLVTPYTGVSTTLSANIDNIVTSIGLTDASTFPTSGTIQIASEKITYTGKSTNTLTGCVRGALSTTAVSHLSGVTVTEFIADIKIFRTNAVLDTSQKVIDNVKDLLAPMRALFTYTQGKYRLIVEGIGSSVLSLNSNNIIGGIKIYGEKKNTKYNRVIGSFVNPAKDWQEDTISFPPADDSGLDVADQYATLLAEDNNTPLDGNFEFRNITNPYQAEELCEIILRRSRNALGVEVNCTSEALNLSIGDIVDLTYSTGGISAKPFRVMNIAINADSTVELELTEHQNNFYTWTSKAQEPTIADTILPNPNNVSSPVSITLNDQLIEYSDGVVITALDVTIGASLDSFVDYYQVEYKLSTDTNFQVSGQITGLNHRILNVVDGLIYNVRVKAINTLGVSSTYTSASRTIIGGIAPPANVDDFACNILGSDAHLTWTQIADLDLAYYQIRYSTLTTGAEWLNSVSLVEKVARPATSVTVPARVGSYLIKAFDKNGNASPNEAIISTNIFEIGNFNFLATQTESPTFSGTKTNVYIDDNDALRLDSTEIFDSAVGLFDTPTTLFDSGVTTFDLSPEGSYLFTSPIDIGGSYTVRVTASITQGVDNIDNLFDSASGLFDDGASSFDGDSPANCNAHLEIATSTDNITYTSFRNFVVGDYTGRYFKFKLVMKSFDLASTPVVSALSVSIDVEDTIQNGNDLVSGTGTYTVVFTKPFYSASYALGITNQGMATGDFYTLNNKTISGFDIAFKNSSGTGVSRTFDYIAKGF